jgi:hypothetical protein
MHVMKNDLDKMIFDIEIFYAEQNPPWPGAEPISWPEGWMPAPTPGGIGFATSSNPLLFCHEVKFIILLGSFQPGDPIKIHLTDSQHNNLGYIDSQRVP